ncbi:hypothetical protein [Nocardia grenadensis]|uniref:hypothetical protein n=1 Tax=Nocardia grenadensis TaxID=931537 RepID=UPI003D907A42
MLGRRGQDGDRPRIAADQHQFGTSGVFDRGGQPQIDIGFRAPAHSVRGVGHAAGDAFVEHALGLAGQSLAQADPGDQ